MCGLDCFDLHCESAKDSSLRGAWIFVDSHPFFVIVRLDKRKSNAKSSSLRGNA